MTDLVHFVSGESLYSGPEAVLCHCPDLIDDDYRKIALARYRDTDGGMRLGGCRQGHYDYCTTEPIQCIVRKHNTWSRLLDLGTLRRIKTDPPDITAFDTGRRHSSIPSSNDCHSSISRCSALSRLAARQAAASVSSRLDNSCSSKRVTRRDRWRAGTAAWNRRATTSGMDSVIRMRLCYDL